MISKNKFQLIVVGTGAYVCGKKEDEYGTILPAILTYAKKFNLRITITFACNCPIVVSFMVAPKAQGA